MRSIVLLLPVLALPILLSAGCDRPSAPQGQATEAANVAAPAPDEVGAAPSPAAAPATPPAGGKVDIIGKLDRSHHGAAAPSAAFAAPGGGKVTLAAFRGKPVLLNLWATWCGPCVAEMPTLDRLAAEGKVKVVPVSQDMNGAGAVAPYFAKAGLKALGQYLDPRLGLSLALDNPSLPTSILYDSNGREVWRMVGAMDWTTPTAHDLLAEAK